MGPQLAAGQPIFISVAQAVFVHEALSAQALSKSDAREVHTSIPFTHLPLHCTGKHTTLGSERFW